MLDMKLTTNNLEAVADRIRQAGEAGMELASAALNDGIGYARKLGGEEILSQVNFPAGYLDMGGRFEVTQKASPSSPAAKLTARQRPTSLSTFTTSTGPKGRGVTVAVQPGKSAQMQRAFVVGIRAGNKSGGNRGVAVRTKGPPPAAAHKPVKLFDDDWGTVWLLYGPSVNQVFSDVHSEILPGVEAHAVDRFIELLQARFGR